MKTIINKKNNSCLPQGGMRQFCVAASVVCYFLLLFFCFDSLNSCCLLSFVPVVPSYYNAEADNNNNNLNPYFFTGFSDAESNFHVSIVEKAELKVGKSVRVIFQISLHKKDKALLDKIKQFFCYYSDQGDVGKVIDRKDDVFYYRVSKVKELIFILDHFDKYPLLSQKRADFELFKQVINLILRQEHLTNSGLQEIVNIKASMNFGVMSDNLLTSFPNTVAVSRPIIKDPVIYDPE